MGKPRQYSMDILKKTEQDLHHDKPVKKFLEELHRKLFEEHEKNFLYETQKKYLENFQKELPEVFWNGSRRNKFM